MQEPCNSITENNKFLPEEEERDLPDEADNEEQYPHGDSSKLPHGRVKYEYPVTQNTSDLIYSKAGESVFLPMTNIPLQIRGSFKNMIDDCLNELNIDFTLNNMQMSALHSILNSQDTIVISPCGTGKLLVFYLAVALLKKAKNCPNGVGWILQPLVSISEDKRKHNPVLPVVFVTKSGDFKTSDEIESSEPIEKIKEGHCPCIFISAEALLSPTGRSLMKDLRSRTVLACTDEVHLFLDDHWGNKDFRLEMSRAPMILSSQMRNDKGS